jgi:hypothetical protein
MIEGLMAMPTHREIADMLRPVDGPPYLAEGTPALMALQTMVDATSLETVLYALAHICHVKAGHLASDWQDQSGARKYTSAANKLGETARAMP